MSVKQKLEQQAAGIKYGCHVELIDGEEPDGCVKDDGQDWACIYAPKHRTREACRYWRPISQKVKP
jgi:hypothetical protein